MKISEITIRRPVFATVINLVVLLVGLIAFQRLSVREYPNIDEPTVSVETVFRGASADVVESQITQPLEESLSGIDGVEVMTSISRAEKSQITVKFRLNRNNDGAAADVRDRVAREKSSNRSRKVTVRQTRWAFRRRRESRSTSAIRSMSS